MTTGTLREILIQARQESARMRHWYLGVEHLFIALLEIPGGLTRTLLQEQGMSPDYVIDAIRRKCGKGGRSRLWAGMPNSPRADIVLGIANDLALERGRDEGDERDVLMAILEEADSVPVRVLRQLGFDLERVAQDATTRQLEAHPARMAVKITFGRDYDPSDTLSDNHLFILRRMFQGYAGLRIERLLQGGHSGATLLLVTPIREDQLEDSPLVAKIDRTELILDEARRYEHHVRTTLPPLTARIEEKPTAPDTSELAGIRYTFVAGSDGIPRDLRSVAAEWTGEHLGAWLRDRLFAAFGRTWWAQRRPYRFQAWMEYDWYLPPALSLEWLHESQQPDNVAVVREPVKRARLSELEYGDAVAVENFAVQKTYPERDEIALAVGRGSESARRAYEIRVHGIQMSGDTYYRGEVVDRIVGTIQRTRYEALRAAASATHPNFDLRQEWLPSVGSVDRLPNPLLHYDALLEVYVNGSASKIHGDLHSGNILVGAGDAPFLIDFAYTRDGHTLADWAALEVSLWTDTVMPHMAGDWRDAYRVLDIIAALNALQPPLPTGDRTLDNTAAVVQSLRQIVERCLRTPGVWFEYHVALAFTALRALCWDERPPGSRRLMFLLAALAIRETQRLPQVRYGTTPTDAGLTDTGETMTRM